MARFFRGTGLSWLLRSGALGMDFQPVGGLRSGNWGAVGEQRNPNTASSGSWPPVRQCETARDPYGVGLAELPRGFPAGASGSPAPPPTGPSDNRKAGSIGGPEHGAIAPQQERKAGLPADGGGREPLDAALAAVQPPGNLRRRKDRTEQFDSESVCALGLPQRSAGCPSRNPRTYAASHSPQPERPPKARSNPLGAPISRRFHAQPRKSEPQPSQGEPSQRRLTAF
jgi:hypothetical protein